MASFWNYLNLTAQVTYNVCGPPCSLICITVNKGAASSVLTVYDGYATSQRKIGTIDASAAGNFFYGNQCTGGITVVMSGGTCDATVIFEQDSPPGEYFDTSN